MLVACPSCAPSEKWGACFDMKVIRKDGPGKKQLDNLIKALDEGDLVGKVGWFEGAKYEDGTPIAYVAAIQEFGTTSNGGFIPPRSFFRTTIAEKRAEWMGYAQRGARAMLKGETLRNVLDVIGLRARGDVQHKIKQINSPPLADSTLAGRLYRRRQKNARAKTVSTKPLIDTGMMLASMQSAVEKKE